MESTSVIPYKKGLRPTPHLKRGVHLVSQKWLEKSPLQIEVVGQNPHKYPPFEVGGEEPRVIPQPRLKLIRKFGFIALRRGSLGFQFGRMAQSEVKIIYFRKSGGFGLEAWW